MFNLRFSFYIEGDFNPQNGGNFREKKHFSLCMAIKNLGVKKKNQRSFGEGFGDTLTKL